MRATSLLKYKNTKNKSYDINAYINKMLIELLKTLKRSSFIINVLKLKIHSINPLTTASQINIFLNLVSLCKASPSRPANNNLGAPIYRLAAVKGVI